MASDNPESFADLDGHEAGCPADKIMGPGSGQCQTPPSNGNHDPQLSPCQKDNEGDCANKTNTGAKTTPDQSQANQTQQQRANEQLAERIVMGGEAAVNAEIAKVKITAAAALGAATPETDGATAIPAALLGISASGNVAAAGAQSVGAITGKTDEADLAAKVVTVATSPTGMTTLIASHGDLQRAARWAAVEAVVTSNPKDFLGGSAVQITAKVIDFIQNVKAAF